MRERREEKKHIKGDAQTVYTNIKNISNCARKNEKENKQKTEWKIENERSHASQLRVSHISFLFPDER